MAQALLVYAVAALLLVASSGPVLREVRDASLGDFEALDDWRSLEEFPFLEQVLPYLPPLVVDWVIVQREAPNGIPPGADYRFDDHGRVVLVFPDGCEETQERYESDSTCAPPEDPCTIEPDSSACDPCADPEQADAACAPPECPSGYVLDPDWPDADPACIPDPACQQDDGNATRPAHCPRPEDPPAPRCDEGHVEAYDGTCVAVQWTLLRSPVWETGDDKPRTLPPLDLKVPYAELWVNVTWDGLTNPGHLIKLYNTETGENICWVTEEGAPPGSSDDCHPERASGVGSSGRNYRDTWEGPIPAQNLTLMVEPKAAPTGSGSLRVELWGIPYEADDGQDDP